MTLNKVIVSTVVEVISPNEGGTELNLTKLEDGQALLVVRSGSRTSVYALASDDPGIAVLASRIVADRTVE